MLIKRNNKIKKALKLLNKLGTGQLFVVDKNKKLLGSLTDGDCRRSLLKGLSQNDSIDKVYNKKPYFIYSLKNKLKIKKILKKEKFKYVPLVDNNLIILKLLSINDLSYKKKIAKSKINIPIVVMAGGKGTRLEPFTKILPKPLIPLNGKAVIEHIISNFEKQGANDFYLSINYKSKIIKSYFVERSLKNKINYLEEKKPLGTAGALKLLARFTHNNYLITNCDTLIKYDFCKILKFHKKNNNDLTIITAKKNIEVPYGVCKIGNNKDLKEINEKPNFKFLVNTGTYIINKKIFKFIKKNKYCNFNHLIKNLIKFKSKIKIYSIPSQKWNDVGTWPEFNKTLANIKDIDA